MPCGKLATPSLERPSQVLVPRHTLDQPLLQPVSPRIHRKGLGSRPQRDPCGPSPHQEYRRRIPRHRNTGVAWGCIAPGRYHGYTSTLKFRPRAHRFHRILRIRDTCSGRVYFEPGARASRYFNTNAAIPFAFNQSAISQPSFPITSCRCRPRAPPPWPLRSPPPCPAETRKSPDGGSRTRADR